MADVVDVIMKDHREVERLFHQLKTDPASRPGMVPVLTRLLAAHSRAEEAEVYPVAKGEAGEVEEVAHSQEEHILAEQLLVQLASIDPESAAFERTLDELIEAVTHHVQEEESTVLPGMRQRLDARRREELAEAFLASRTAHLGDLPDDIRKSELRQQASNVQLPGASSMTKDELQSELRRHGSE